MMADPSDPGGMWSAMKQGWGWFVGFLGIFTMLFWRILGFFTRRFNYIDRKIDAAFDKYSERMDDIYKAQSEKMAESFNLINKRIDKTNEKADKALNSISYIRGLIDKHHTGRPGD